MELRGHSACPSCPSFCLIPIDLQAPPPPVGKPIVSNMAACSADVSWEPPADYWHALAVTGYQVHASPAHGKGETLAW